MKKNDKDFEKAIRDTLKGKKVPILVLDSRWHALFPEGNKPSEVVALEKCVNILLKQQGRLVNELKDLKKTKKKLMDGIVAGMSDNSAQAQKKKDNQQRLLLEIKERISEESDELMTIPSQIKKVNEDLLIVGAKYCFEKLENVDREMQELTTEITALKEVLNEKSEYKAELEESIDSAYSLMHGILGHDIMNLFDKGKI